MYKIVSIDLRNEIRAFANTELAGLCGLFSTFLLYRWTELTETKTHITDPYKKKQRTNEPLNHNAKAFDTNYRETFKRRLQTFLNVLMSEENREAIDGTNDMFKSTGLKFTNTIFMHGKTFDLSKELEIEKIKTLVSNHKKKYNQLFMQFTMSQIEVEEKHVFVFSGNILADSNFKKENYYREGEDSLLNHLKDYYNDPAWQNTFTLIIFLRNI